MNDSEFTPFRLARIGTWLGLAYGFLEAAQFVLMANMPGGVSWQAANSPTAFVVSPFFYALAYLVLALLFGGAWTLFRTWPRARALHADTLLLVGLVTLSGVLATGLLGRLFSTVTCWILGLGFGLTAGRFYDRRRTRLGNAMAHALPHLAIGCAVVAGLIVLLGGVREHRALARLAEARDGLPNVLLIVLDTQRADHLSVYGYERPTSPRLEQLAREGVLVEHAYAPSSWTLPSHATLMTGRSVQDHRAGELNRPFLDQRYPTLAEALRDAGYVTGGFVANLFWTGRTTGLARGFVHYEDFYGNLADALSRTALGRKLAYTVGPRLGFIDIPGRKHAGQIVGDFLAWQRGVSDRPFFAFLNFMDVHAPYLPPPPFAGRFSSDGRTRRPRGIELGAWNERSTPPPPEELRAIVGAYDEATLYLDSQVGALLDSLRTRGVLDRTLVIVTADHGEGFGEHGMINHGNSLYRDQISIPLLLRFPARLVSGSRIRAPVGLDQLPRSILELAGIPEAEFPGASLLAQMDEPAGSPVLSEIEARPGVPPTWPTARGWLKSLADARWHYIIHQAGDEELFDLVADPDEVSNLANDSAHASIAEGFRARIHPLIARRNGGKLGP